MNRFLPRLLNRLLAPALALGVVATAAAQAPASPLTVKVITPMPVASTSTPCS